MEKNPVPGDGIDNPDHISESLETIFWVKKLKFFDAAPGSGMEKIRFRDKQLNTRIRNTAWELAFSCLFCEKERLATLVERQVATADIYL